MAFYLCEDMTNHLLVELPYWGNISFYAFLYRYPSVSIEACEHFEKSSYRNRCEIAGVNGKLMLSIPIEGGKGVRRLYKDVRISYDHQWQRIHWQSLCSAYRRSPYFEYYEDELYPFYHKKEVFLYDLNMKLFEWICKQWKQPFSIQETTRYEKNPSNMLDYRVGRVSKDTRYDEMKDELHSYIQVFSDRSSFLPNLSILDLVFNEGPKAVENILVKK